MGDRGVRCIRGVSRTRPHGAPPCPPPAVSAASRPVGPRGGGGPGAAGPWIRCGSPRGQGSQARQGLGGWEPSTSRLDDGRAGTEHHPIRPPVTPELDARPADRQDSDGQAARARGPSTRFSAPSGARPAPPALLLLLGPASGGPAVGGAVRRRRGGGWWGRATRGSAARARLRRLRDRQGEDGRPRGVVAYLDPAARGGGAPDPSTSWRSPTGSRRWSGRREARREGRLPLPAGPCASGAATTPPSHPRPASGPAFPAYRVDAEDVARGALRIVAAARAPAATATRTPSSHDPTRTPTAAPSATPTRSPTPGPHGRANREPVQDDHAELDPELERHPTARPRPRRRLEPRPPRRPAPRPGPPRPAARPRRARQARPAHASATAYASATAHASATATPASSAIPTSSLTPYASGTPTSSAIPTLSPTPYASATPTSTAAPPSSATATSTPLGSPSATATPTPLGSPSATGTATRCADACDSFNRGTQPTLGTATSGGAWQLRPLDAQALGVCADAACASAASGDGAYAALETGLADHTVRAALRQPAAGSGTAGLVVRAPARLEPLPAGRVAGPRPSQLIVWRYDGAWTALEKSVVALAAARPTC